MSTRQRNQLIFLLIILLIMAFSIYAAPNGVVKNCINCVEKNCKDLGNKCLQNNSGCVADEWHDYPACRIHCCNEKNIFCEENLKE